MTVTENTSLRLRRAATRLFGVDSEHKEPGSGGPPAATYAPLLVVAVFSAVALYAASIDLGFSADGAWSFVRILDGGRVGTYWSRLFGDLALLWPLALAVEAGVKSVPLLDAVFHFGLYLPFLLSFAVCWYASRSLDNAALLLFPLASYLLVVLPAASILIGTNHVLAVAVWPILFLLLRPRVTPVDGFLLLALLVLLTRTYESAAPSLGIFLCLLAARLWVDSPKSRPILLAAMAVVVVGLVIQVYWAVLPGSEMNRTRFIRGMFRSVIGHKMLILAGASTGLLAVAMVTRRFGMLALSAVLVAAASIMLSLSGRTTSAGTSFNLRSLSLTLLPLLLTAAIAFHYKRPALASRQWIAAGITFGLLGVGYAASWTEWREFRRDFVSVLESNRGYLELADTSIVRSRQDWPWTHPLLSVLWSGKCVRSVVLNPPDIEFQPFDPQRELPLQKYVAYTAAFSAASPISARCN